MKVTSQETKTGKSGKPFYSYTLDDGTTATGFDPIPLNVEIGETHEVTTNGNFRNLKSKGPMHPRPAGLGGIAKAQERKAEYIEKAQDKKELSIAYFNATNGAISLLSADIRHGGGFVFTEETIETFTEWRDFFLAEWKKWDAKPETEKRQPF